MAPGEDGVKTRAATVRAALRSLWAIAVAGFAFAVAPSASATPLDPEGTDWEGLADLVSLARAQTAPDRVFVSRTLDFEALSPDDALLIVHPETELDTGELESFIDSGGRVVLLDDYGTGSGLLGHFGIQRVPLPSNPLRMLRSNPALALAEVPARAQSLPETLRDLREIEPVVTNHATGLSDTGLLPLLAVRGKDEPDVLLAVAGAFGRGRLLAVGDASVAMNAMLRYPGNRSFTVSLVRYLSGASETSANPGRLYILVNDATLTGEFGAPPLPKAVRSVIFELFDTLKQGLPSKATYFAAVAAGLVIILWASSRAGRPYKASLPRFVRPIPVATHGGFAGHLASLVPGPPRRALIELRRALEEEIGLRLGLERPAPRGELVARLRARGMLGESDVQDLDRILERLSRESGDRKLRPWQRLRRKEIVVLVERSRGLLAAMEAWRRDRLLASP